MAQLPPIRRLILQDYAAQGSWLAPLFQLLNDFMSSVYNALNQGLTIAANTTGSIVSATLISVPTPGSPASIPWSGSATPQVVLIGNVQQRTVASANGLTASGTLLTAGTGLEWQYVTGKNGNFIQLTNVPGVPAPTGASPIILQLLVFTG